MDCGGSGRRRGVALQANRKHPFAERGGGERKAAGPSFANYQVEGYFFRSAPLDDTRNTTRGVCSSRPFDTRISPGHSVAGSSRGVAVQAKLQASECSIDRWGDVPHPTPSSRASVDTSVQWVPGDSIMRRLLLHMSSPASDELHETDRVIVALADTTRRGLLRLVRAVSAVRASWQPRSR